MSLSNNTKPELRLDWCSYKAAKYACEHWHYSGSLPVGKLVKVGVWEDSAFIGCVLFAWGANKSLGSPYGLAMTECCELVRIALTNHVSEVSRVTSLAIKFLKKQSPGLKLIVSFADPSAGHHGGIYQAGNWVYTGPCSPTFEYRLNGQRLNKRAFTGNQFGKVGSRSSIPSGAVRTTVPGKHRYLYPLIKEMRAKIAPLAKPYPKHASNKGNLPDQGKGGGAVPT